MEYAIEKPSNKLLAVAELNSDTWAGVGLLTFAGYNGAHLNDTWFYSRYGRSIST